MRHCLPRLIGQVSTINIFHWYLHRNYNALVEWLHLHILCVLTNINIFSGNTGGLGQKLYYLFDNKFIIYTKPH